MERFTRNEQLTNAAVIIQSLNSDATKTVFPLITARHSDPASVEKAPTGLYCCSIIMIPNVSIGARGCALRFQCFL